MRKAGIIGGFEFIGSYMTLKFLSENYRVKVPVSSLNDREKVLNIPGLLANKFLEVFHGDLHDLSDIRNFVSDCDVVIHCGTPFRLNKLNGESQLFVPEIRGTGALLKVLSEFPGIQKLIFVSPPAILDSAPASYPLNEEEGESNAKNSMSLYHAKWLLENAVHTLEEERVEVIFVSPVKVSGNTLISSGESISIGFKRLFEGGINHDPVFRRILQQVRLETFVHAENVSEAVFDKVSSMVHSEMG